VTRILRGGLVLLVLPFLPLLDFVIWIWPFVVQRANSSWKNRVRPRRGGFRCDATSRDALNFRHRPAARRDAVRPNQLR
jgi:hypothetical protein